MKKLIAIALSVVALSAFAAPPQQYGDNGSSSASSSSQASQSTTASNAANNAGNSQNITFTSPPNTTANINYGGEYTVKNVPSVNGPNLTTSNDTCMGSTSGSVNIAGLGVGGGTAWVDENCKMLKNSRELWNMGMKAASMALMCTDKANKEALELTGYVCPQTKRDEETRKRNEAIMSEAERKAQYAGTDPIVRDRMGLPPKAAK